MPLGSLFSAAATSVHHPARDPKANHNDDRDDGDHLRFGGQTLSVAPVPVPVVILGQALFPVGDDSELTKRRPALKLSEVMFR